MKLLRFAILFLLAASRVPAQTSVTIQNPSFETFNTLNSSCSGGTNNCNGGPVPSWTGAGCGGSFQPTSSAFTSLPAGPTVLWSNGGACNQDLGVAVQGGTYNLTVSVGMQSVLRGSYNPTWTISLLAGTTTICSNSGSGLAEFQTVSLSCPVGAPPSGHLSVSLGCSGIQCNWDNVALTLSPHAVTISWNAAPAPATHYRVKRATQPCNPCSFTQIADVTTLSYTDATVVGGNFYVYVVTALDASNNESISFMTVSYASQ